MGYERLEVDMAAFDESDRFRVLWGWFREQDSKSVCDRILRGEMGQNLL